jgi:hypothetical protein
VRTALREEFLGLAHKVAAAAGGFLGIHKVSHAEEEALAEIGQALA